MLLKTSFCDAIPVSTWFGKKKKKTVSLHIMLHFPGSPPPANRKAHFLRPPEILSNCFPTRGNWTLLKSQKT